MSSRKVCGFLGHSAELGCSEKETEIIQVLTWYSETNAQHRSDVECIKTLQQLNGNKNWRGVDTPCS